MEPELWRKLPKEVVELVFSHLIARDINALQLVSKDWKSVVSTNFHFQKLCQQASNNNMFAIMSWNDSIENFTYYMFDYNSNIWRYSVCRKFTSMIAKSYQNSNIVHSGGLVCFLPEHNAQAQKSELPIVVYNPLTSVSRDLPLHSLHGKEIVVAQLLTNHEDTTSSYKLMIVCFLQETFEAECYDSTTGTWSKMREGFICGHFFEPQFVEDLCIFDCAQGTITDMSSHGPQLWPEFDVFFTYVFRDCAYLMKQNQEPGQMVQLLNERGAADDRVVNLNGGSKYELVEFQMDPDRLELKRRKSYVFPPHPFEDEICNLDFLVCGNSIFIIAAITMEMRYHELNWLYDMSRDVWRVLPRLPRIVFRNRNKQICELRWDIVP